MELNITTANVNGMTGHWHRIKNEIKTNKNCSIMCLQETHRADINRIQIWAERNNLMYFPNHLNKDEPWVDTEEKKTLYFKGTGIFARKDLLERYNIEEKIIKQHRIQCIILTDKETKQNTKIWNIYGPADVGKIQTETFRTLAEEIAKDPHATVICGDLNIVIDPLDAKYNTNFKLTPAAKIWKNFVTTHKIKDIWRWHNPRKRLYTVIKKNQSRRVDQTYISNDLFHNTRSCYGVNTISDHIFLQRTKIKKPVYTKWGNGAWKNDCRQYEEEELRKGIKKIHEKCTKNKSRFETIYEWWDHFKNETKKYLIKYGIQKRKADLKKREELKNTIEQKQKEDNDEEAYVEIKKLQQIEASEIRYQCKLYKLRDMEENEKPTNYFFQKIKQRKNNKTLTELENAEGRKITSKEEIMKEAESFYKALWKKSKNNNTALQEKYLQEINDKEITEDDKANLERLIEIGEIRNTIQNMENNKTPGLDGLSREFYASFWQLLKKDLVELINNAYIFGGLCESWKQGLTTIIYKKGDPNKLKNWRPITLLNTDYKILTGILSRRLGQILPNLIQETQKCAIKQRKISDILQNIQAVNDHANERKREVMIISLDQEKAFDLINHTYLYKILESYRLPKHLVRVIKNIYSTATSRITINGAQSEPINIERGIRQGCPLSMPLYAVVCDPLARKLQKNISGYKIGGTTIKLQQYADDMTVFAKNENEIKMIFREFGKYEMATGQKLNPSKTEILHLNEKKHTNRISQYQEQKRKSIKILGQIYGENQINETWNERYSKIRRTLYAYRSRRLTWIGKKIILDSLITTQVIYNARAIPVPTDIRKEIERMCYNFLWHPERMENIARKTLIAEKDKGGMGIPDIESKIKACELEKVIELKRIGKPKEIWQQQAIYELGTKIKKINKELYSNSEPHKFPTPKKWLENLDTIDKIKWKDEDWEIATHKSLYQELKQQKANNPCIRTKSGSKIKWEKIAQTKAFGKKLIKNEEVIINYKTAHNAYAFGEKKRKRNITRDRQGKTLDLRCKFCRDSKDDAHHVITECKFGKDTIRKIESILDEKPNNDAILFNKKTTKLDWIVISIYKKTLIKLKINLDIENRKVNEERLERKILSKLQKRLEPIKSEKKVSGKLKKIKDLLDKLKGDPPAS